MWEIIFLLIGIAGVLVSAEILIRAAQIVSHRFGISETFIGLTILSIGTSLPELGTHIIGSIDILRGSNIQTVSDIVVSTNIGSNIVQITAILGLVALLMKVKAHKEFLDKDYIVMLGSIVVLWAVGMNGSIGRGEGLLLAAIYIFYIWTLGSSEKLVEKVVHHYKKHHVIFYSIMIPVGIVALLFTSDFVLENAVLLINDFALAGTLVGGLIIGLGTAVPELTTALVALRRKSTGMSIGVLVGSNITNPMLGIGLGAAISTYAMAKSLLYFDIPFWFAISLAALFFFKRKKYIEKKEAAILIAAYAVYLIVKIKFLI